MRRWFYITEGNDGWRDELDMRFDIWRSHLCERWLRGHHWRIRPHDVDGIFNEPYQECRLCKVSQSLPTTYATAATNTKATITWTP